MELKLELSEKQILKEKFTKDVKGYDSEEVDAFLDRIIDDYRSFWEYVHESEAYTENLEKKILELDEVTREFPSEKKVLQKTIKDLEEENASLKNRLGSIKPGDVVTEENIIYLDKINRYEEFLNNHGIDPQTLKPKK